jgi:hypothetical protein
MEKIIDMKKYGLVLTGREFGSDVMINLGKDISPEDDVILDFKGVISLGSSFADEVIVPIALLKNKKVKVKNLTPSVESCLVDVAIDNKIEIQTF